MGRQDVEVTVVMAITEADVTIAMGTGSITTDTEKNTIVSLITGSGSMAGGTTGNIIRTIVTRGERIAHVTTKGIFDRVKKAFQ